MMNSRREVEWIRDYLVGRLPEEERIAFEDRLARDPALVHEFEQSLGLRAGLRELRAQSVLAAATSSARYQRTRPLSYRLRIAAAAVIVGATLVVAWRVNQESSVLTALPAPGPTSGAASLIATHFTFVAMRGGGIPKLALPSSGLIELRAAPEMRTTESYRVTLVRAPAGGTAERVGVVTGLRLGTDGYLHCYADSSRLAPGSYGLRIEATGTGSSSAQVFPFVLQPAAVTASP